MMVSWILPYAEQLRIDLNHFRGIKLDRGINVNFPEDGRAKNLLLTRNFHVASIHTTMWYGWQQRKRNFRLTRKPDATSRAAGFAAGRAREVSAWHIIPEESVDR
jgi:hypothetical protein